MGGVGGLGGGGSGGGYIGFMPSICLSVHPACCIRSVAHCLFHGLYSYVAQIHPRSERCVAYHLQVNRSKVRVTWVIQIFEVGAGGNLVAHRSTISNLMLSMIILPSDFSTPEIKMFCSYFYSISLPPICRYQMISV